MPRKPLICLTMLALIASGGPSVAASYPVSGRWTYADAAAPGPALVCGPRYVDFRGERRFDPGGSVPDYRLRSIAHVGTAYRITDELFNGQVHGHVDYMLRLVDPDHVVLHFATGDTVLLRRCA